MGERLVLAHGAANENHGFERKEIKEIARPTYKDCNEVSPLKALAATL